MQVALSTSDGSGVKHSLFYINKTLCCMSPGYSATADDVARLHSDLFSTYKRVIPPVFNQTHAVKVRLSLFLLMIHDLVCLSNLPYLFFIPDIFSQSSHDIEGLMR